MSRTPKADRAPSQPPLDPAEFDFEDGLLWAMHCADGPSPRRAVEAARAMLERENRPWTLRFRPDVRDLPADARRQAARVLGADADDISLLANTSAGLVSVAQGLQWRPGDRVVLPLGEFPTNVWPWLALELRGVEVRTVPLWYGQRAGADAWASTPPTADTVRGAEERLLEALEGARGRQLLAASWVRFQDGLVLDLARLASGCRAAEKTRPGPDAHSPGIDFVVDGIQGAGLADPRLASPEMEGIGAFATGGHKGLLGPHGSGLLYTSAEFRSRLVPTGSWLSVEGAYDFRRPNTDLDRAWLDDGLRLEQGTPNLVGTALLHSSLELLADAGIDVIEAHVADLRCRLLDGLARLAPWRREAERLAALDADGRLGPIVALHHGYGERAAALPDGERRARARLDELCRRGYGRGIYTTVREGYLRVALHGWHRHRDIDRLLDWLGTAGEVDGADPSDAAARGL